LFNKHSDKELILPEGFVPVTGIALGYSTEPFTEERVLKLTLRLHH